MRFDWWKKLRLSTQLGGFHRLGPRTWKEIMRCGNYFQSIDTEENRGIVSRFKARYGAHRVTDDPMEAGYFGVYSMGPSGGSRRI